MRVLVCGGRKFKDWAKLERVLNELDKGLKIQAIINGGAKGADKLSSEWALDNGIIPNVYEADWYDLSEPCFAKVRGSSVYNALAGHKRNQKMLDEGKPDLVVAFPGGSGTADMVDRAKKAGIEVKEIA